MVESQNSLEEQSGRALLRLGSASVGTFLTDWRGRDSEAGAEQLFCGTSAPGGT